MSCVSAVGAAGSQCSRGANWFADFPDSDNFFYIFFHSESSSIRGIYYAARYRHQRADGATITVELDQYCGRLDRNHGR